MPRQALTGTRARSSLRHRLLGGRDSEPSALRDRRTYRQGESARRFAQTDVARERSASSRYYRRCFRKPHKRTRTLAQGRRSGRQDWARRGVGRHSVEIASWRFRRAGRDAMSRQAARGRARKRQGTSNPRGARLAAGRADLSLTQTRIYSRNRRGLQLRAMTHSSTKKTQGSRRGDHPDGRQPWSNAMNYRQMLWARRRRRWRVGPDKRRVSGGLLDLDDIDGRALALGRSGSSAGSCTVLASGLGGGSRTLLPSTPARPRPGTQGRKDTMHVGP